MNCSSIGLFSDHKRAQFSVNLEHIHMGDIDQFSSDCVAAYEAGYEAATARGIKIKALLICNPHNPLGMMRVNNAATSINRGADKADIRTMLYARSTRRSATVMLCQGYPSN